MNKTDTQSSDPNFQYGRWLASPPPGEEVVISGMSGRFPESNNVHEFRDHLLNKMDMVSDDDRRWKFHHPHIPKRGGRIHDVDKIDAGYFGMHFRQAKMMDPLIRTVMEPVLEAILDAGINPSELAGTKTGVYLSACYSDSEIVVLQAITEPQTFAMTGYLRSFMPHRVSYYLKLRGPALIVDTACSSSSTALDIAFRDIRNGLCDNAIVGGVNVILHPGSTLQFFLLGVLSGDGSCKVFDQNANGYVRGEASACVFLQKAKHSKRIYAKIINTKSNSDGFKEQGITFPSLMAQKQLMEEIYNESNIPTSDVSFVEAHGTGTVAGDPQEMEAIDCALAKKRQKRLLVGSVKSSIGHTEPASGIASVIKVLLAMESGVITPNINLKQIKKGMSGLEEGRIQIVRELTALEDDDAIVGVNNFGFGGSNIHVILQRFQKTKTRERWLDDIPRLVCVSGRTQDAVEGLLNDVNTQSLDSEHVGLLHQIFKNKMQGHLYRGYTIVTKNGQIKTSTQFYPEHQFPLYLVFGPFTKNFKILGTYLWKFPIFRSNISKIDNVLKMMKMKSLEEMLENDTDSYEDIVGSICVQICIVDILKYLEICPIGVYGEFHSKFVCEYYYDTITIEETIRKVAKLSSSDLNLNFLSNNQTLLGDNVAMNDKNIFIFNISDDNLSHDDVLPVEDSTVQILEVLGSLYQAGHIPQLHKLYPEVEYPVSRNTPMISPSIRWDHARSWHTYKFREFRAKDVEQKEFLIQAVHEDYKFIQGHIIDGRNLFPATEYLHLVWETFVKSREMSKEIVPVVFEDCKFVRAVTVPETGYLNLLVTIQRGSSNFEVLERNSVVVSGRVRKYSHEDDALVDLEPFVFDERDKMEILEQDEIYRELYLRGYKYSGAFNGIVKCNTDASTGLIRWENNWSSFIDKMLQMKILQTDTRMLFVPVGIKKLTIISPKHLEVVEALGDNPMLPVHVYKNCNLIKSGGIEIRGLEAKSISRKKLLVDPVVEKYEFVPNSCYLDLMDAVRINTQIIIENSSETTFKAIEIVEDCEHSKNDFLLHAIFKALEDLPVVIPDLTISSKMDIEATPGVKVENVDLTPQSNLLLVIGNKLLECKTKNLEKIFSYIHENGFILTREEHDFVPEVPQDVDILTEFTTPDEKLILFRKHKHTSNLKFLEIPSSNNFDWLSQLQNSLKRDHDTVIYSKNDDFGGILGLANCVRREIHGNKLRCLFVMDQAPEFDPEIEFFKTQIRKNLAINVYKGNTWGTYRHLLLEESAEIECEHCYANTTIPGNISSLRWLEGGLTENTPVPEDSLLVKTFYSALNFKDIMAASGRINAEILSTNRLFQRCLIGMEFSGMDLKGRRMAGIAMPALSSHVIAEKILSWEVPDSWSLEDASTVSVVYWTVIYALLMMTDLTPGTSILIHSATGGIGLAALNVCLYHKCDIYLTVGTQEKRQYLRKHYPQIPESHIGNSRDTSFEDMIKTETEARGVDIVLNSLTDDKLEASVRCLAFGGRFMEIGKYNAANNTSLNILLLERGATYHGVMADCFLFSPGDAIKQELMKIFKEGLESGLVKPINRTVFAKEVIEAAFRYMMTGQHIGKVLVKIRNEESPLETLFMARPEFSCDVRCSYVIVGGLGGIGLELADWLILRGARKIILTSRSGVQNGYQMQRISIWKSYGVQTRISTKSVTNKQGCIELIREANALGPVDAVFNLAAVLKDAPFEDQTEASFLESFAPKAETTRHLDQVTRELCPKLRYFVVFSSVSCGLGNQGQSNYGMANSIMERICERRKLDGLPALAIQWGAIGEVGLVARMQKENKELVIGGTLQQRTASCFEVLDRLLKQHHPVVSSMVVAEKYKKDSLSSPVEAVAHVLGIKDIKTVGAHVTLAELGMDSMMGTELLQLLEKDFDIYITAMDVRNLTFAKLEEMESGGGGNPLEKDYSKAQMGTNLLIQFVPDITDDECPMVRLPSRIHENDEGETVFVLAGVEGVFHSLEALTKQLRMHVIGVRYSYHNPEDTIQEMANTAVTHIETKLSKRTFTIMGYSLGTLVALEAAILLESKGYEGRVVLIDGSPASIISLAKALFSEETEAALQTAILFRMLQIVLPLGELSQYNDKFLQCATLNDRIDLCLALVPSTVIDKQKLDKQAAVSEYKRVKATLTYEFANDKIRSEVHLFKAKNSIFSDKDDRAFPKMCERSVAVTIMDGDHVTIINNPELAKSINDLASITL